MSLLPLPTRRPERKHVLAAVFGLLGVTFMIGAVLTASGLALPFTSHNPDRVRAGSIVVDLPTTTTAPANLAAATPTTGRDVSRAVEPVAFPAPASTTPTSAPRGATTTAPSTTLPTVPPATSPTLLPPLGGLGRSGLGRG
jgi:hypothetical protein